MEEVDQYLDELNLQDKVNNYIEYGIKPIYKKQQYYYYPKMDEKLDSKYDISKYDKKVKKININIPDIIKKCEKLENELLQETNQEHNECPICFQKIEEASYVTPKCGHKVCLKCYICCLEKRTTYSNSCSICRQDIL
jgi:hypothetical protein